MVSALAPPDQLWVIAQAVEENGGASRLRGRCTGRRRPVGGDGQEARGAT